MPENVKFAGVLPFSSEMPYMNAYVRDLKSVRRDSGDLKLD